MSGWTWVLIGLGVAGVLLGAGSLVPVALEALKLRAHVRALSDSRLFMALQSMQIQMGRLSRLSAEAGPLVVRAQTAIASIRESAGEAAMPQVQSALNESGAEIAALAEDLR